MKTFYSHTNSWTAEATTLDHEIMKGLKPIFEKWIAEGYNPREPSLIAVHNALVLECMFVAKALRPKKE